MRNLLALFGLVIVLFLGIGYSRGWYNLDFTTDASGKVRVEGDIDSNKIRDDSSAGLKRAGDAIDNFRTKNSSGSAAPPAATLPVQK